MLWLECLLFTLLHRSQMRLLKGSSAASEELQRRLLKGLEKMLGVLDGSVEMEGRGEVESAGDLLEVAVREKVLGEEDLRALRELLGE